MKLIRLKISLLFTFLLAFAIGNTQNIARKFVLDEETQTTIPFVKIQLKNNSKGWITDANGVFDVNIDQLKESDIFLLSAMGYQNLMVSYKQFNDSSIITMLPKIFTLNEVEIKTRSYKKGYLGQRRRASNKSPYDYGVSHDVKYDYKEAIYIPNTYGAEGIIESVNLFVHKGSKSPIKIELYGNDIIKGEPTVNLLDKPLLVKEEEDRKWLTVSLKNENISIPKNGFYIAIDWNIESIYLEKEDTFITEMPNTNGEIVVDSILSRGLILGEAFTELKNRWRTSTNNKWINTYEMYEADIAKDNPEDYNPNREVSRQTLAIYTSILYDNDNKHYQENIFDKNGLVPDKLTCKTIKKKYKKTKPNPAFYPQNDILSLLKSIQKTQTNKEVNYSLQHLYFYTYEELEDIINKDLSEENISLPFIDELIENIDKLIITEIEQGLYSFEYDASIYGNLQLKNGEWKISPTFNVISDTK